VNARLFDVLHDAADHAVVTIADAIDVVFERFAEEFVD